MYAGRVSLDYHASSRLGTGVAVLLSTPTAALHAARGDARPDTPTPVRSLSMSIRSRRRIQVSGLFAIAATRAAYHRIVARMGPRGRPPVIKFVLPIPALSEGTLSPRIVFTNLLDA